MCFTKQNEEDGLPGFGGNWHQLSQTGTVGRYLSRPYLQLHSTHCQPRELLGILSDSIWLLPLQSGPLDAVLFPVTALKDHWSSVENPKKKTNPHRAFRCSVWQEEEFSKLGNHPMETLQVLESRKHHRTLWASHYVHYYCRSSCKRFNSQKSNKFAQGN